MMILIADSGSTKADWTLINSPHPGRWDVIATFHTQGITPVHQTYDDMRRTIAHELMPQLSTFPRAALVNSRMLEIPLMEQIEVYFYGSGCTPAHVPTVKRMLSEFFTAEKIRVESDLMAAAHALCGHSAGVACILGTGANSCLYDGEKIVQNTPALGYILGDEGSGAVLGRKFLNALYKGRLPEQLKQDFEKELKVSQADIIQRVYREPQANKWLASLSTFVAAHIEVAGVRQLVIDNFREFLVNNVRPYNCKDLPVSFVGSMAEHYQSELEEAARSEGFTVGQIVKSPMDGLVKYHCV